MKWLLTSLVGLGLLWPGSTYAQIPVEDDCVIRNFVGQFTLNSDSSLDAVEDLTVDCGDLPDKHGIFRILPTQAATAASHYINTPVVLKSITDNSGISYKFATLRDYFNHTVTWKIGDADQTISGLNYYKISYQIKNVVFASDGQDHFNFNLIGAFWQLPIEQAELTINLPNGVSQTTSKLSTYSGASDDTANLAATSSWVDDQTLLVQTNQVLEPNEGVTINLGFPTGLVNYYQPSALERFGWLVWLLIPIIVLLVGWRLWRRYGRDPKMPPTVVPEFGLPGDLRPLPMALLVSVARPGLIAATMVDLAVRGYLKIEELAKQGLLGKKDWQLTLVKSKKEDELTTYETKLLEALFDSGQTVTKLAERKTDLGLAMAEIYSLGKKELESQKLIDKAAGRAQVWFLIGGILLLAVADTVAWALLFLVAPLATAQSVGVLIASSVVSFVLLIIFTALMGRRTEQGTKIAWLVKGFQLYLKTAEKYRQQFFEKEGIFDRYLPYAIAFGLTKQWAAAFQKFQRDNNLTYAPIWFVSTGSFDVDSFSDTISNLSSGIASSVSSSSGGGSVGGGSGGGGGGSW